MNLLSTLLLVFYSVVARAQSDHPVPKFGTVHVSGQVTIPEKLRKDTVELWLFSPEVFTGGYAVYKTHLEYDGRFALEVNIQTDISRCAIRTDLNMNNSIGIQLKSGQENKVSFRYNNDKIIDKIETSYNSEFTEIDILHSLDKLNEMAMYRVGPAKAFYNKPVREYSDYLHNALQQKGVVLNEPPLLSEKMKEIVFKEYSIGQYALNMFDYHESMVINYRNNNDKKVPDSLEITKAVPKDYVFLKNLDLNNPLYLYCYAYSNFTQELLRNDILNIPRIHDTPIPEWTKNIKKILVPLIGFDQGLFYDMLISNAYAMQFILELKPLTPKQIENINAYYRGGDIEKILLRKNNEVAQQARLKDALVINSTPDVAPEDLMSAILSRYKGKIVIVDFWATWCVPCLEAFKESRNIKKQLADRGVVFIYVTNPSSPGQLWEKYIQGIGGEQYYLTKEQWNQIVNDYDFSGIPAYLIFDKNGELKHEFTGYPGNDDMLKKIEGIGGR